MSQRRAGIIALQVNGEVLDAKGSFSYGLGAPQRTAIIGADGVHGFTEAPQAAFIEGEITDRGTLDLAALTRIENATVTLTLANGKVVALRQAWYAADGVGNTEEANIAVRFEGASAEEIPA